MIHAIYIYLIINAFVAGMFENEERDNNMTFFALLFGAPLFLFVILRKILRVQK